MKLFSLLIAAAFPLGLALPARSFTVSSYTNQEDLAAALLATGWNPVAGSLVVSEDQSNAIGFFNDALVPIGIDSGVLLTTGSIFNALGPNTSGSISGSGVKSSLSFDFVAVSPGIQWKYVFASEEYEEYVDTEFNDIFTLTLDGVNLALIPGTLSEVAINSVNPSENSEYYRSNIDGSIDTEYDGLTTVLTATASNLVVGQTYNVSFNISDVGDSAWDSGVFIEANSVVFDGATPETPLLPADPVSPGDPWEFPEFGVFDPDFTFWLDPDVAIGYIYSVADPLGPLFDEFTAPILPFDNSYELFASTDSCATFELSLGVITGNVPFGFAPQPCIALKGIDVANMLDPSDTAAFNAGLSFDKVGLVSVTQTPITQFVPDSAVPGPLPLLGMGAAFGWSRRLRRRLAQSGGSR
jgi:hypothetical protein